MTEISRKFRSFWDDKLTTDMLQKAKMDLGETITTKEQILERLKLLIAGEKNLSTEMDDAFLLRFLRHGKYNPEKAYNTLARYCDFKSCYPGFCKDDVTWMRWAGHMNFITSLPYRTEDGAIISYFRLANANLDEISMEEVIGFSLISLEVALNNALTQICGVIIIFDYKGVGTRFLWKALPFAYSVVTGLQNCLPFRLKAAHLINAPLYYRILFNTGKAFMTEKTKNRVFIHGDNVKSLHKHIPPEILPLELDGYLGPSYNPVTVEKMLLLVPRLKQIHGWTLGNKNKPPFNVN